MADGGRHRRGARGIPRRRRRRLDRARRRGRSVRPISRCFTTDALDAYRLYAVEVRHPVEVPGDQRPHLVEWLSKRVGSPLRAPELDKVGLKLVGGRLLPGPTGATAFFMYEGPSGERFTLYCGRTSDQRDRAALHRGRAATRPIIGSIRTSPMCSAARPSRTSCTRSHKRPTIRSISARRCKPSGYGRPARWRGLSPAPHSIVTDCKYENGAACERRVRAMRRPLDRGGRRLNAGSVR